MTDETLNLNDLLRAASSARQAFAPLLDGDWSEPAGTLSWSMSDTLDHVVAALTIYAVCLATRDQHRPSFGVGSFVYREPAALPSPVALDAALQAAAMLLARVAAGTPDDVRGYHPDGPADRTGFIAMGCDEILVHAYDIMQGFGFLFHPDEELCRRVVRRLFPWAPEGQAWETLLWSNGRIALPGRGQLAPDWPWHCRPLSEWQGEDPTTSFSRSIIS